MTFTILDSTSATLTTGTFSNTTGTLYTDARGDVFKSTYLAILDGDAVPNDVTLTVLTVAAVPEPSTWAVVVLSLGLGVTVRRLRTRP